MIYHTTYTIYLSEVARAHNSPPVQTSEGCSIKSVLNENHKSVLVENCNSNKNPKSLYQKPILWNTHYFLGWGSCENCSSELQFLFRDAVLKKKHKLGRSSTRTVYLRSLFYVMEHIPFSVVFLRRNKNWFSLKIARKLRFSRRTDLQLSLRTDFMEQPSENLSLTHFKGKRN